MLNIEFLDFIDGDIEQEKKDNLVKDILITSKRCFDNDINYELFSIRHNILFNKENIIVVVDGGSLLGFCVVQCFEVERLQCVEMIQSFVERQRVATRLLDYVQQKQPEWRLVIRDFMRTLTPFFRFYLSHNPRSWPDIYWGQEHQHVIKGPQLTHEKVISVNQFAVFLKELKYVLEAFDVRPLDTPMGGIFVSAPFNDENLTFSIQFNGFINKLWPSVSENWFSEWIEDRSALLATWDIYTAIVYDKSTSYPLGNSELFCRLQECLAFHGISTSYAIRHVISL